MWNLCLTKQPAILCILQLFVEHRSLEDLGVLKSTWPVGFCAEQQSSGIANKLTAHRVKALLVHVWWVFAVRGFDRDLEVKGDVWDQSGQHHTNIYSSNEFIFYKRLTWTQSSTPSTPGNPASLWNSSKDCSLLEGSLFGKVENYNKIKYHNISDQKNVIFNK